MEEYQILIIEDDPNQLKILTGQLIEYNLGFKLLIANNGRTGIEIAMKNRPDIILMDWEMPVLNGLEATKILKSKEETKSIPIIMVTGTHGDTDRLKEALDAGAVDFVNKPYNALELIARIRTQLRQVEVYRKLMEQQRIISEQEKNLLAKDLDHQQKQLALQTVNMAHNSELHQSVINDLQSVLPLVNHQVRTIINSIELKLNDKSNEHIWREFEYCFENVYHGFYKKLNDKIPDLSVREKRLCSFLKMEMSTKEIAAITFQTPNAIDVAKHRIRKKSGIETDEDFTVLLMSL